MFVFYQILIPVDSESADTQIQHISVQFLHDYWKKWLGYLLLIFIIYKEKY